MENVKQKKTKKRKLDTPTVDNVESEEDESTKPKKLKLSKNEVNAERRIKNKDKVGEKQKRIESPEVAERTIFIGNIPIQIEKKKVKRHFKKYGQIESIRIRGIPVADPKVSKKVASIKKEFNPKRNSVYCYIRFANKEDAKKG
ncbi:hypothetical protein NQ318_004135 [Aromia moschata]|uniref:RRM domain-containing protein n=1 Tax=Aromia moschata TaxID=1265417 RepID=A0AAV8YNT4_9CUCU|nr:hypothetical protein NQ318_004135 [Aromia moschata]